MKPTECKCKLKVKPAEDLQKAVAKDLELEQKDMTPEEFQKLLTESKS